jgi:transcriptional regulator with XRE-family HTH domain
MKTIGARISYYRRQKNLTQEELADLTAIKRGTIAGYESDVARPTDKRIKQIAFALEVDPASLVPEFDNSIHSNQAVLIEGDNDSPVSGHQVINAHTNSDHISKEKLRKVLENDRLSAEAKIEVIKMLLDD